MPTSTPAPPGLTTFRGHENHLQAPGMPGLRSARGRHGGGPPGAPGAEGNAAACSGRQQPRRRQRRLQGRPGLPEGRAAAGLARLSKTLRAEPSDQHSALRRCCSVQLAALPGAQWVQQRHFYTPSRVHSLLQVVSRGSTAEQGMHGTPQQDNGAPTGSWAFTAVPLPALVTQ